MNIDEIRALRHRLYQARQVCRVADAEFVAAATELMARTPPRCVVHVPDAPVEWFVFWVDTENEIPRLHEYSRDPPRVSDGIQENVAWSANRLNDDIAPRVSAAYYEKRDADYELYKASDAFTRALDEIAPSPTQAINFDGEIWCRGHHAWYQPQIANLP